MANILSGKGDAKTATVATTAKTSSQQSKAAQTVVKGKSKPMGRGTFLLTMIPRFYYISNIYATLL